MSGGTFILSCVCNGRRITTDPIPYDADEATTNVAIADATRKDQRDMLQKVDTARNELFAAENELADAKSVETAMSREETDLVVALNEAHTITYRARIVTMDKTKAVLDAKDKYSEIKNILYGADYGYGQRNVFSAIYGATEKYTAALAKTFYSEAPASGGRTRAAHSRATEAPKDSHGCPRTVIMDDVVAAYAIVTEAVAVAERANETAVSAEAMAIAAFDAHLAAKDKAIKSAAKTYAATFVASCDIGAADTAAKILFSKVCKSDVRPAWDVRTKASKEAVVARTHATDMHGKATKLLEDARALRVRASKESIEAAQMTTDALAAAMRAEAKIN